MDNKEDIADFQGVPVNFSKEYIESRRLMGLKTTDLSELHYNVGLMYLSAPNKWMDPYANLMYEIGLRQEMLARVAF